MALIEAFRVGTSLAKPAASGGGLFSVQIDSPSLTSYVRRLTKWEDQHAYVHCTGRFTGEAVKGMLQAPEDRTEPVAKLFERSRSFGGVFILRRFRTWCLLAKLRLAVSIMMACDFPRLHGLSRQNHQSIVDCA
jgi:hypothetical protein